MDELVAWLRDRLDEDFEMAQVANALTGSPWTSKVTQDANGRNVDGKIVDSDGFPVVYVESSTPERAVAEYIARWDPARVLAEVEAKRRILAEFVPKVNEMDSLIESEWGNGLGPIGEVDPLIKLLAQPYAGQLGWREEWAA